MGTMADSQTKRGSKPTITKSLPFVVPPKIIHEFKESELVQDMEQVTIRKHWWSRKHTSIYILTSSGIYEMRVK